MLNLFNRVSKIRNVLITFFFLTQVRVPLIWVTLDALCGTMLPLTGQSSTLNNWQLTVHFFLISHILQIGVRDEYHRLRQKGMEWWPPAAGTCRSWWTLARGGPAVCESWRTATGPGWWQVASGCGCPACEPSEGPAWTAAAVFFFWWEVPQLEWIRSGLRLMQLWAFWYLVVQHEQDSATNTHVAGSLYLKAISLLGGCGPVPLKRYKDNVYKMENLSKMVISQGTKSAHRMADKLLPTAIYTHSGYKSLHNPFQKFL